MKILVDDLKNQAVIDFLEEHVEEMKTVTPVGSKHALDLEGLRAENITFWAAWMEDQLVACAALKQLNDKHGELKSMRCSSRYRGKGIASKLLTFLIQTARVRGYQQLSLETGSFDFFKPARNLYRKFGFTDCPPFGDYEEDPNSSFMTLELEPDRNE